jgi:Holliday junction resolvasome RuvABC endonuclease subunit
MNAIRRYAFVVAVYPNTRGFAFVLFEGHLSPIDWGVKEMRGRRKHSRCVASIDKILNHYQPDIMVLQDTSRTGTHRARRVTNLNTAVATLASSRGIPVYAYSRDEVSSVFGELGLPNKHSMAEAIAKHIPAFERYVPPPRKAWMSEDARMGLFDAAALALVFFQRAGGSDGQVG